MFDCISLSRVDIPELVVPIIISLIEVCYQQRSYWTKGSWWLRWSHHFERFTVAIMAWLTAMEYLYHKWPQICIDCRNHNPVLSSLMTYHRVCNKRNTTGATCEGGTANPSGAPSSSPVFSFLCNVLYIVVCPFSFCNCAVCPSI
jgi:hypothetical protein